MFEWLSTREPIIVYIFLFFNAFFESIFPPYPSDAFVLVFSFVAGQGHFNPYLVYIFTVIGSICGIMILYYLGKSKGEVIIQLLSKSFLGRIFPMNLIEKARQKFIQRGDLIIFLNRFLPGMRAPICFAAGIVKTDSKKVFVYSLISVLLWNLLLVVVGFYVGSTWHEASMFLRSYNIIATLILFVVLIILVVLYSQRRRE